VQVGVVVLLLHLPGVVEEVAEEEVDLSILIL
jgi:hypothetical protein